LHLFSLDAWNNLSLVPILRFLSSQLRDSITPIQRKSGTDNFKGRNTEAIKSIKNSKAPGFDEIRTEFIKVAGEPMVNMLEKIFRKA